MIDLHVHLVEPSYKLVLVLNPLSLYTFCPTLLYIRAIFKLHPYIQALHIMNQIKVLRPPTTLSFLSTTDHTLLTTNET